VDLAAKALIGAGCFASFNLYAEKGGENTCGGVQGLPTEAGATQSR